jgi:hypothetical protein
MMVTWVDRNKEAKKSDDDPHFPLGKGNTSKSEKKHKDKRVVSVHPNINLHGS